MNDKQFEINKSVNQDELVQSVDRVIGGDVIVVIDEEGSQDQK